MIGADRISANLTLHTDKYQINMMYAHWLHGTMNQQAVFEMSFRSLPFGNGYAVFAGLERMVDYVRQLRFTDEEIDYLREQEENYDEAFLSMLKTLRFTGDIESMQEGTLCFPNQPLLRVKARIVEAQLIETAILNFVNFQTLIATKAARVKQAAPGDYLMEFGTRRAQESAAAVWGARAAYLAGFDATSNMRAGMLFGIPTKGTHAHSWVQSHTSELAAFERYAEALPDQVTLLVDTYDTLRSGVPNAIKVGHQLAAKGKRLSAIRLDSGDLAYLSKQARIMLDEAGLTDVKITASNDLDENLIFNLKAQGAKIDSWGVGTKLITAADQPAFGGVYKLVAIERDGKMEPVIKISANPEKVSTPGIKNAYRLINLASGKAEADYLAFPEETEAQEGKPLSFVDPAHPYLNRTIEAYQALSLLTPIFQGGECVYELPTLQAIRSYHEQQLQLFWPEYLRKLNPENYPVGLSPSLWQQKVDLLKRYKHK